MSDCEYELVVLRPEDFEEVVSFLEKHFFTREPLSLGLHIVEQRPNEGRLSETVRAALCSGVSIGARVKTNGELAGIRLSVIKKCGECGDDLKPGLGLVQIQVCLRSAKRLYLSGYRLSLFEPPSIVEYIYTLLEMAEDGVDMFGSEQKLLVMILLNVAEEHGKKGLGTRLVKECIRLGIAAGCNRAVTNITNRHSGHIFKKLGFETVNILDLTKLGPEYKGPLLDIDRMNGNTTISTMIKQGLL